MPKTIKREIIIPELIPEQYLAIQKGFCDPPRTQCGGLNCSQCAFSSQNIEAFVDYLDLGEIHGSITVIQSIRKETEH